MTDNKQPKPISVVYIPSDLRNGKEFTWEDARRFTSYFEKKMPDYYWFVIPKYDAETIEFKVFYSKDFTEIQYAQLKKIIEDAIQNNT